MQYQAEVIDILKLEKNDNQVLIGIENLEETCVKLEEVENELPVKDVSSGTPVPATEELEQIESVKLFENDQIKIGIEFTSSLMTHTLYESYS